jgi:hypothetical protein
MAAKRREKAADFLFEGVVIPKQTRSAKIAAKGIANEDDMGRFLTAVFSDTLNGNIILPTPGGRAGVPSRMPDGTEHKLRRGLPVTIQAMKQDSTKKRRTKVKESGTKESAAKGAGNE